MTYIQCFDTGEGVNFATFDFGFLQSYTYVYGPNGITGSNGKGDSVSFKGLNLSYRTADGKTVSDPQGKEIVEIVGGGLRDMQFVHQGKPVFKADFTLSDLPGHINPGGIVSAKDFYNAVVAGNSNAIKDLMLGGRDMVIGTNYDDVIDTRGGEDTVYGMAGNDRIYGGSGNDRINGGQGADKLWGGSGVDTFAYMGTSESTVLAKGRDTIYDFTPGDRVDLSAMDANTKITGDQAFAFIATKAFSGKGGELRYEKRASDTYIYADTNGDRKADFAVHLDHAVILKSDDFIL
ncbi:MULTISPECIES: calcium-binding protein [unclassified Rhizobium]|uniref:calcium-binding protein n=1 Tax=unclassified Rhizobium TaxID=2613769 RepID=UPI000712F116|nr:MULTISPECIES: hypothetical protein [unclassified Rhizobium]KQS87922.1 hypothetical protein ASG50_09805 [Rhizobium sp. Leaf386]KQS94522.1 hypothetical protein ASG42_07485 [Rhizobium sp. Leaf391]KQU01528.1 hypothetical protein ASG68_07220 [Rhizobium sp. Leaf453]